MTEQPTTLKADRDQLSRFIDALFRYADSGTWVTWRAFSDERKDEPPVFIQATLVCDGDHSEIVNGAVHFATVAAQAPAKAVFCPPIATFVGDRKAREIDLANGLALSVECDTDASDAREVLERILGPATVVVASGGLWKDTRTGDMQDKLHLHWRLDEPTTEAADHARLKRARILATAIVGGDATNVPAVHPIRWPGSWHRKGNARLAHIVAENVEREINLTDALSELEAAAQDLAPDLGQRVTSGDYTPEGGGNDTSALIAQLMGGDAMHAPLVSLSYRYLRGGMTDAQAVLTLRGLMDAMPAAIKNNDRWRGHYNDISRTVSTAREKVDAAGGAIVPVPVLSSVVEFAAAVARGPAIILNRNPDPRPIPAELLHPPGVLADVAQYGLESAVRPVPIFAVQAALALGSIVCARRYVSSQRNYSSLYFLNVAKSGTGKEEAKTTIEAILTAAGARRLIGGSSYTSGNAVYSALLRKPQHLTIIDEFGKYLEAASSTRDSFRADALTMLMESFGRVHGDMATPQFSSMTMSATQASNTEPKIIQRPAITLLALTTPSSFYEAMRSARVVDGFLNRILVAEHIGPRAPMAEWRDVDVPLRVVEWVQRVLASRGNLDNSGQVDNLPDPVIVPLTPAARARSALFERKMLALADSLERDGLGDMPIRTREIGLRLALITALSVNADLPSITADLLDWCFAYAEFFLHQTVTSLRDRVADSSAERTRNTLLAAIRASGLSGVTNRELHRNRPFVSVPKRDRLEAIEGLLTAELVAWADVQPTRAGGRPRKALVALDFNAGDEAPAGVALESQTA